jgi:hypothetical protein
MKVFKQSSEPYRNKIHATIKILSDQNLQSLPSKPICVIWIQLQMALSALKLESRQNKVPKVVGT